jgi:FKBP-type peptidyl-prolyl cis-trans isomerase FkpA
LIRGAATRALSLTLLACAGLLVAACGRETPATSAGAPAIPGVAGLQTRDLVPGTGAEAVPGSRVTVHYTGWLYDPAQPDAKGRKFDSSRDAGRPFAFDLGSRQVIAGWDQGVQGMRTGGQRELVIPASLAYGERGAGGVIPPGATLVFDVELLAVEPSR